MPGTWWIVRRGSVATIRVRAIARSVRMRPIVRCVKMGIIWRERLVLLISARQIVRSARMARTVKCVQLGIFNKAEHANSVWRAVWFVIVLRCVQRVYLDFRFRMGVARILGWVIVSCMRITTQSAWIASLAIISLQEAVINAQVVTCVQENTCVKVYVKLTILISIMTVSHSPGKHFYCQ